MKLQELVQFNQQSFFEGAVQLGWFQNRIDQANIAAESFIFHGPHYHGAVNEQDQHLLKDTASLVVELLESLSLAKQGREDNPYWLATAGYGAGKSHLAVTLATLLSKPNTPLAQTILTHIERVDATLGQRAKSCFETFTKPSLIIALDGMGNFHLGNQLNKVVLKQLDMHAVDAQAVRDLSPRFNKAQRFVERSYQIYAVEFQKKLAQFDQAQIFQLLTENNEDVYAAVDQIFLDVTGSAIPVDGQESAQDLLQTLCDTYCGTDKPFENIILLFDEFGRYLEYAADRPDLAGDSSLQQIFQGIQDNANKIRFIGFIQYDLKTYLKRFNAKDSRQLQRYITRFDTANKVHLSSNLETIFANLIQKDTQELTRLFQQYPSEDNFHQSWLRLAQYLPKTKLYPVWHDENLFNQVIAKGCWPLHPFATWLLTRQEHTVQSRSALTFIRDLLQKSAQLDVFSQPQLFQVSAADLVHDYLLDEMLAAERDTGANVIETLQTLLQKFHSGFQTNNPKTLTAIAILETLKLRQLNQSQANEILQELTNFDTIQLQEQIMSLSELGATEWNSDLGRYELLTDGASRASFTAWMKKTAAQFTQQDIGELFISKSYDIGLGQLECDFAQKRNISTPDWVFQPKSYVAEQISCENLEILIQDWQNNMTYKDAKGRVIYIYLNSQQDLELYQTKIQQMLETVLAKYKLNKLPFLFCYLNDQNDELRTALARLKSFEIMSPADQQQFMRFIQEEKDDVLTVLKNTSSKLMKQKEFFSPYYPDLPLGLLKNVATALFEHNYKNTIPFVFDGFRLNTATAPSDIAALFSIMVNRQFSIAWLQGQKTSLQNRFDTLFKKNWQAVDTMTGKFALPQQQNVKSLYNFIETTFAIKPDLDLKTLYQKLVMPSYGLNDCSFALILGIYLAQETPQYRILHQGKPKNLAEWLNLVLNKKTGTLLNLDILAHTQLQKMEMSTRDEWILLFKQWSQESNPKKMIDIFQSIENKKKVDPIPLDLEIQYNLLFDKFKTTYEEHKKQQDRFDATFTQMLRGLESSDIRDYSKLLQATSALIKFAKDLDLKKSHIELPTKSTSLVEYISQGKNTLSVKFNRFFDNLVLTSHHEIINFREKSEQYQRAFITLQMQQEANKVQDKTAQLIQRIEEKERFKYLLQDIESYIHTSPNKTMKKKELETLIKEGDRLLIDIDNKPSIFDSVQTLVEKQNGIRTVQNDFRQRITDVSQQFANLYGGFNELNDLKIRLLDAEELLKFFVSTEEYEEILKIQKQLQFAFDRTQSWITQGLPSQKMFTFLNQTIVKDQEAMMAYLSEQQIDAEWDFIEEIFKPIRDGYVKKARSTAEHWLTQTQTQNELSFTQQDISILRKLVDKVEVAPEIFDEDQIILLHSLKDEIRHQFNQCHMQMFQRWFVNLESEFMSTSQNQTGLMQLRTKLKNVPHIILPLLDEQEQKIITLQKQIASALDLISLEDLAERINTLSPDLKQKLLKMLN